MRMVIVHLQENVLVTQDGQELSAIQVGIREVFTHDHSLSVGVISNTHYSFQVGCVGNIILGECRTLWGQRERVVVCSKTTFMQVSCPPPLQ